MKVVIAEKPSLAKAIRAAVGSDYTVTNAFGHIYEQAEPDAYLPADVPLSKNGKKQWRVQDLPIVPDKWIMLPKSDAKEQIGKIKALLKDATEVINAGDPDREGQLLIDEIVQELKFKGSVKRVWLTSLTPDAIRTAFKNLKPNADYKPLSDSAQARSHADWLVGMNLTRAWTLKNGGLVSVGRVQTPTLALIVQRDLSIDNFKAQDYFDVFASVKHKNGTFSAKWKPAATDGQGFDEEGRLIDKAIADAIARKAQGQGVITAYKADAKKRAAPLPFSLSALQKAASAKLGLGAQKVLDIAQSLYEQQITSYPRTDCQYMGTDQLDDVFKVAAQLAGKLGVSVEKKKHAAFDAAKVTAHTAIVPTGASAEGLRGDEKAVFDMIAKATVALFMPDEEYLSISATFTAQQENFSATGKQVNKPGWTVLYGADDSDEEKEPALPVMQQNDAAEGVEGVVKAVKTKPLSRLTEGTLIDAMSNIHRYITDPAAKAILKETSGIGTEATRANVIETLFKRGWIEKKGKQIISTDVGKSVVRSLTGDLTDPVTTAKWEDKLSEVASGKLPQKQFEDEIVEFIRHQLTKVSAGAVTAPAYSGNGGAKGKEIDAKCPKCQKTLTANDRTVSCACGFTLWKTIAKKELTVKQCEQLITSGSLPEIKGFVSKEGKPFAAGLALDPDNSGKVKFVFKPR